MIRCDSSRVRQRDDETAREEGQGREAVDGQHQVKGFGGVVQADAKPDEEEQRDDRRDRVDQRLDRKQAEFTLVTVESGSRRNGRSCRCVRAGGF